ncbi:hypothetical protein B484DRAFT_442649 [Ochromonadaceae sp. CCMP2298]|nr:hypothetical protein B484DRAFT_442649 [Ochromonadaceae sp. CCMP2298]
MARTPIFIFFLITCVFSTVVLIISLVTLHLNDSKEGVHAGVEHARFKSMLYEAMGTGQVDLDQVFHEFRDTKSDLVDSLNGLAETNFTSYLQQISSHPGLSMRPNVTAVLDRLQALHQNDANFLPIALPGLETLGLKGFNVTVLSGLSISAGLQALHDFSEKLTGSDSYDVSWLFPVADAIDAVDAKSEESGAGEGVKGAGGEVKGDKGLGNMGGGEKGAKGTAEVVGGVGGPKRRQMRRRERRARTPIKSSI